MKKYILILSAIVSLTLSSCEDVIDIKLKEGQSQLVVDGWLTDQPGKQVIKLRNSINYFNNVPSPGATGAKVTVSDALGRIFEFKDTNNNGDYEWLPSPTDSMPLGVAGNVYKLKVEYNNEVFNATAFLNRVTTLDSIWYEFREGTTTVQGGYYLNLKATDLPGEGDLYWFKVVRNDSLLNKPSEINLAYDGAFGPGSDGIDFIPPIIFSLTPRPYYLNDTVTIKLYSIDAPTYFFLTEAQVQMTNSGLFATPPANVHYNIYNDNKDSKVKAVGWFGASAITSIGVRIKN